MKTIYISGKIAGCEPHSVTSKFLGAEFVLHKRFDAEKELYSAGEPKELRVINPVRIKALPDGAWFDYMMRDLVYLKHCDTIYMLKDWKDSAGARIEHEFAKKLGLEIIYEENEKLEQ